MPAGSGGVVDEFWSPDKCNALPITCTAHHQSVISADGRTAPIQARTVYHFPSVLQHIRVSDLFVSPITDAVIPDLLQPAAGLIEISV